MRNIVLLIAVSMLALSAPSFSQGKHGEHGGGPGGGPAKAGGGGKPQGGRSHGGGKPQGGAPQQQQQQARGAANKGGGQPHGAQAFRADRGDGKRGQDFARDHGPGQKERGVTTHVDKGRGKGATALQKKDLGDDRGVPQRFAQDRGRAGDDRPNGKGSQRIKDERGGGVKANHGPKNLDSRDVRNIERDKKRDRDPRPGFNGLQSERVVYRGDGRDQRDYGKERQWMRYRDARDFGDDYRPSWSPLIRGCPPGLAKKKNGCLPPGQARPIWGYERPYENWYAYPTWYRYDNRYDWRYSEGYLYRVDRTTLLITAFLPLLGGALYGGNLWPSDYTDYSVDPYYDRYYGYDDDDYDYRYADGAIFAVDPQSQRIEEIVALLTGDRWAVGERIPDGYDIYNIPPDYRDRYFDSDEAWYRYSDGYIYEVDPATLLIRQVIELLVNG